MTRVTDMTTCGWLPDQTPRAGCCLLPSQNLLTKPVWILRDPKGQKIQQSFLENRAVTELFLPFFNQLKSDRKTVFSRAEVPGLRMGRGRDGTEAGVRAEVKSKHRYRGTLKLAGQVALHLTKGCL